MELVELLDGVKDRPSFFEFVEALIKDRKASAELETLKPSSAFVPAAGGWEVISIESYLESALAWARDSNSGVAQGFPEEPTWKAFATFLYCGKLYE